MNIVLIIVIVMAVLYGLLMLWYRRGWERLLPYQVTKGTPDDVTKVTIIIPARNEEDSLPACLESVLSQHYPAEQMEIIVVNDHSTDQTAQIVEQLIEERKERYPKIKLLHLADYLSPQSVLNSYKKKAIETAVEVAEGELIITTDADCTMTPYWVGALAGFYRSRSLKFIAAPVSYDKENNFFKIFQSLDFLTMQGITGATTSLRCGTMCNGANLAYQKQAFLDVGGYQGIDCIASGDDMLLMYKMYKAYPEGIGFLKHPHAIVQTVPADNLRDFLDQRIRWASKSDKYEDKRITTVLAFVYLWNLQFLALFVAGFFYPVLWWLAVCILLYKTIIELIFLLPVAQFFKKSRFLWLFFPAQFLHIPYIVVAGWLGKFGNYEWKGRKVK